MTSPTERPEERQGVLITYVDARPIRFRLSISPEQMRRWLYPWSKP